MTKNEIVATFMGYEKTDHIGVDNSIRWKHVNDGKIWNVEFSYSTSYDWLMPAWVKFRDLRFDYDQDLEEEHSKWRHSILSMMGYAPITKAFDELVKGIEWYNQLKK